jgi:cytochrome b subunit of formate dehydrogenase
MSSQLLFRVISLLGLIGIIAAIVWAIRSQLIQMAGTKQTLRQQIFDIANSLRQWRTLSAPARLNALMRFFYLATLAGVFILALTGFLPIIIFGQHISDFALMMHMLLAPLFAIGVTALALFWAQRHRFNKNDWEYLLQWARREESAAPREQPEVWQKLCFWLVLLSSGPILISIVLMMYPLFDTAAQQSLLYWHGYSGLLLLAVVVLHTYMVLSTRRYKALTPLNSEKFEGLK